MLFSKIAPAMLIGLAAASPVPNQLATRDLFFGIDVEVGLGFNLDLFLGINFGLIFEADVYAEICGQLALMIQLQLDFDNNVPKAVDAKKAAGAKNPAPITKDAAPAAPAATGAAPAAPAATGAAPAAPAATGAAPAAKDAAPASGTKNSRDVMLAERDINIDVAFLLQFGITEDIYVAIVAYFTGFIEIDVLVGLVFDNTPLHTRDMSALATRDDKARYLQFLVDIYAHFYFNLGVYIDIYLGIDINISLKARDAISDSPSDGFQGGNTATGIGL